jgi:hypothetical protein
MNLMKSRDDDGGRKGRKWSRVMQPSLCVGFECEINDADIASKCVMVHSPWNTWNNGGGQCPEALCWLKFLLNYQVANLDETRQTAKRKSGILSSSDEKNRSDNGFLKGLRL